MFTATEVTRLWHPSTNFGSLDFYVRVTFELRANGDE